MPKADIIARLLGWWQRIENRRRIIVFLIVLLLIFLLLLLALRGCQTKKATPPTCAQGDCATRGEPVGGTVEMATYSLIDGCWTFDFGPAASIRLHRDPRSGRIDARIFHAPADFSSNVEWRDDPFATDGWRETRFKAIWQPPVLTLIHPIESLEEWAFFNLDRYPQGLDQVLEYHGDTAVRTVRSMASQVIEEGTALRYRIRWRRARPAAGESGPVIVSHDPEMPGRWVAEVIVWPSTRVFDLGPEGWRTVELPEVDAEQVFDDPAASGQVMTDGYMRPILDGRAVAFRTLRVVGDNPREIHRASPVMIEAHAASQCPYAQETARFKIEPVNFDPFGEGDEWRSFFLELVETAPDSGIFRTATPVRIDIPVHQPFAGRDDAGRPREALVIRLTPEGAGSEFPATRIHRFDLHYEETPRD